MARSRLGVALASAVFAVLIATVASVLAAKPGEGQTATVTLVGAGDIARCGYEGDENTARLLGKIPGKVFTLGDNVYPDGTLHRFSRCYHPSWGRFKARTKPAVGNHEYRTPGADGYFDYFGTAAGERGKGYYSYDRGAWHIVALNSMCAYVEGGCEPTSPMITWLKNDLAAHPSRCTLAYFHHPLFSSGYSRGKPVVKPLWDALYAAHADVIVNAHDHVYERFARQTPTGAQSERGIREFVVGTGGAELGGFNYTAPNSQVRNANTRGVLKMRLAAASYRWKFVHVAGKSFTDSGSTRCRP